MATVRRFGDRSAVADAFILYPFTILATWFHEMGHGLSAIALDGRFNKLMIFPNGSGLAYNSGRLALGAFGQALVSAGGLIGPPIAGMALLLASRQLRTAKRALFALGILLMLSTFIWVRSLTGWLVLPLLGAVMLYAGPRIHRLATNIRSSVSRRTGVH